MTTRDDTEEEVPLAGPDRSEIGRLLRSFPRPLQERVCVECRKVFQAETKRAQYCSNTCKQRAKYRRSKGRA